MINLETNEDDGETFELSPPELLVLREFSSAGTEAPLQPPPVVVTEHRLNAALGQVGLSEQAATALLQGMVDRELLKREADCDPGGWRYLRTPLGTSLTSRTPPP